MTGDIIVQSDICGSGLGIIEGCWDTKSLIAPSYTAKLFLIHHIFL